MDESEATNAGDAFKWRTSLLAGYALHCGATNGSRMERESTKFNHVHGMAAIR